MNRYHRQILLPQIGPDGQARLANARALLVGCGALGTVLAEQLVRAGIGTIRIVDRDIVELTNLQRQVLFDERDVQEQTPKAIAAARRLRQINSSVVIEEIVADLHAGNVEEFAGLVGDRTKVDIILDGTDNAETRYLLNDVSVKYSMPWVYGACVGMTGRAMAFHPPETACLRCLFPTPPDPGELPTCDTAGVFSPVAAVVASLQSVAATKVLLSLSRKNVESASGPLAPVRRGEGKLACSEAEHGSRANAADTASAKADPTNWGEVSQLITIDLWENHFRAINTTDAKRADCISCGKRQFEFLDRRNGNSTVSLCGRNAVQVRPPDVYCSVDLRHLATKLSSAGRVELTDYLLRCDLADSAMKLTVFPDGRLIVHGIIDPDRAKSIYARYIGS